MRCFTTNQITAFSLRLLLLYLLYALSRLFFGWYNISILGAISWQDFLDLLRGGFVFDSASIFYVNIPFIILSLFPYRERLGNYYKQILAVLYTATNSAALFVNLADVFYFPFKLSRFASDDFRYAGEGNAVQLIMGFLKEYWWGVVCWLIITFILYYVGFVLIREKPPVRHKINHLFYLLKKSFLLIFSVAFAIFAIRGFTLSAATFPLSMSDATNYVSPRLSSLVLSNPFCMIRTAGKSINMPEYMPQEVANSLFTPMQHPEPHSRLTLPDKTNVVLIILESFGSAHIKSLAPTYPKNRSTVTPFLDSLFQEGLLFTQAYQSGGRSIDALPSLWASIPSFKQNFLSLPQSTAQYKALPKILADKGYSTAFLHGAVHTSMSFYAFGQMAGIQHYFMREEYEALHGNGDSDGKWGIWDHLFFPFALKSISSLKPPFFATLFTLSSHHPFQIPSGYEMGLPENVPPIDRAIAYSDRELKAFFAAARNESWYPNTLFVLVADHASFSDRSIEMTAPRNLAIPLFFYMPSISAFAGKNDEIVSQLDFMPTILSLLGNKEPYFAFGKDIFNSTALPAFTINYNENIYNMVVDTTVIQADDKDITAVYDYRKGRLNKQNAQNKETINNKLLMKAYIQQYYYHLKKRQFLPQ